MHLQYGLIFKTSIYMHFSRNKSIVQIDACLHKIKQTHFHKKYRVGGL